MIPKLDGELRDRTPDDYTKLAVPGVSRALFSKVKRETVLAVAFAYSEAIQVTAEALASGGSVLVRGTPNVARAFVEVLAPEMQRDPANDFLWSVAQPRQDGVYVEHDPRGIIPNPSHQLVCDFQVQLSNSAKEARNTTCVIDFLDLFAATPGTDQSDLLYLFNQDRTTSLLAFCSPDLVLPPLMHDRFTLHVSLPRLRRERVWALLTLDEIQKTFKVDPLTVAHQVALYHAIAGTDVIRFREIMEGVNKALKTSLEPFRIIDQIRMQVLTCAPPPPMELPRRDAITEQLEVQVICPFDDYARAQSAEDVQTIDARLAHTILLGSKTHERGALIARWLAGQLNAPLIVTNGAALADASGLFRQARQVYPSVIFIQDLELGLLGGGEPLRALAATWQSINVHEPLIVIASTHDAAELPPAIRTRFKLSQVE